MITNEIKQWIEAGKRLAINPNDEILCPLCNKGILRVIDSNQMNEEGLMESIFDLRQLWGLEFYENV